MGMKIGQDDAKIKILTHHPDIPCLTKLQSANCNSVSECMNNNIIMALTPLEHHSSRPFLFWFSALMVLHLFSSARK
jgi:hypothetical protein